MESLWILIPLSLAIAVVIGWAFCWAVSHGQMDDLDSPAMRILIDDDGSLHCGDPVNGQPAGAPLSSVDVSTRQSNQASPII